MTASWSHHCRLQSYYQPWYPSAISNRQANLDLGVVWQAHLDLWVVWQAQLLADLCPGLVENKSTAKEVEDGASIGGCNRKRGDEIPWKSRM